MNANPNTSKSFLLKIFLRTLPSYWWSSDVSFHLGSLPMKLTFASFLGKYIILIYLKLETLEFRVKTLPLY
ncbi:Uncharacterized protein TCM_022576 [Theobroma cacao]|uniref:Uncharacterized protein n=1 Tax=Theobroma cacao TaxID=3641 RepID=A0A061ETU6_THECC|nr:Uncharacterized protein TCM_022576 [Theobroma cacao]